MDQDTLNKNIGRVLELMALKVGEPKPTREELLKVLETVGIMP